MTKGVSLANGAGKEKRRELDYYPTPPEVTEALMEFLGARLGVVWEPACGEGHMAEVLKKHSQFVIASDLRHTGYGEGGTDFLTAARDCDAIITNPPFNLSEQFIRHAVNQAPLVAMLLKSQYWHAAKRYALFSEMPPAYVLALTWRPDFLAGGRGGAPTMDVHWTVWQAGETSTRYRLLRRPNKRQRGHW